MRSKNSIVLTPDETISDAMLKLRSCGASGAEILQDGKEIAYLALRSSGPERNLPENDAVFQGEFAAELRMAKKIQQKLMPRSVPQIPGLSVYGTLLSANAVGGDYWSVKYYRNDNRVTLKIADVTGHGIAAALLVPAVKFISGGFYRGAPDPAWVMERTNHVLVKETPVEIAVSMIYCWYHTTTRRLTIVNAGHSPAFLIQGDEIHQVPTTGPLLGLLETPYSTVEFQLQPGDLFFSCTDGITEARSSEGFFGEERVAEIVFANRKASPAEIGQTLLKCCFDFGGPPHDDRSLIVAKAE